MAFSGDVDVSIEGNEDLFDGEIFYIESVKYRENWLYLYGGLVMCFAGCRRSDVVDDVWLKWRIKKSSKGPFVFLESVKRKNYFFNVNDSNFLTLKEASCADDQEWAKWYIKKVKNYHVDGSSCVQIYSKHYSGQSLAAVGKIAKVLTYHPSAIPSVSTSGFDNFWFNLYQPPVREQWVKLADEDNTRGDSPIKLIYAKTTGISKVGSTVATESVSMGSEIGLEIEAVFKAGTKFSTTWTQTKSETWEPSQSVTHETVLEPGKRLCVWQLVGFYGEPENKYRIGSNELKFTADEIFDV